jgi:thiol-disulfide isomerase/thioredoxin
MRKLLALAAMLALMLALSGPTAAQDPKDPKESKDSKLKIGDKAPPVKATKWLQGKEVKSFEEGKVYVMEFWATWCGPCIVMMPHMGELQAQYKDKVTFIGFTAKDPNNSLEKVTELVTKRGPKLGYTFVYADDRDTYDAYMKASGQGGIPCCFVIDKAGKIAFIGHPMYLDVILPKVVEGKWTEADLEALKGIEKEVDAVFRSFSGDPEAALKALADFEKKYPPLAHIPYFVAPKIGTMIKAKKVEEAKKEIDAVIAKAVKQEDPSPLRGLVGTLIGPGAKDNKELTALGVKAAEAMLKMSGEKDPIALYFTAEAHFANGDKAKAKDFGSKAVAAAEGNLKKQIEGLIKKYDDEEKKEEKK